MTPRTHHRSRWPSIAVSVLSLNCGAMLFANTQGGAVQSDAVAAETESVPEAVQKILNKAVKAMGGHDAIDEIDAMHTKMELSSAMGSMTSENWWQKPNKSLSTQSIPGMGEISTGSDGKVWWRSNPMTGGYQLISEEEADSAGPGGFVAEILDMEKLLTDDFKDLEALGEEEFDGRKCDRIRGVSKDQPGSIVLFFDTSTGLPAGAEMTDESQGMAMTSNMYLRDWKKVDTITLFHTMVFESGPQTAEATVQLIEFNNVPATVFKLPDEVQDLVDNKPERENGESGGKTLEDFNEQQQAMIKSILNSTQHVNDPQALQQVVDRTSASLSYLPPEQKEAMEFAIQKIKERIKELGG